VCTFFPAAKAGIGPHRKFLKLEAYDEAAVCAGFG
jgi:hypothetical protein